MTISKIPRDNLPRGDKGRKIRGKERVHHNKNQQKRSCGGYHNNRSEFKIYPHKSGIQQTIIYDRVK